MESLYLSLPLLLAIFFLTKHLFHIFKNLPPSPFPTLPILGHQYLFKHPIHPTLSKLSARYGPVLLLHLGSRKFLLFVSSPSAAEECFTKNDVVFANRPRLLAGKYLGSNYSTLVWASYGENLRKLRRIVILELFSVQSLQMLEELRADEVRSLLIRISKTGGDNINIEMRTFFFEMMLNIFMRMIVGKSFYGEKVEEVEEAREFQAIIEEIFRVSVSKNMVDFLPFMRWFGGFEKRLMDLQVKMDNFMQGLVEEIRKKKKESENLDDSKGKARTMVDVLLSRQETEAENYTDETIKGIMIVMLTAGSDTSVGTMEWALALLLNHPHTLKKAQKEIDEKVGHARLINESDLAHLPYLRCIMNETMRMYPVAPLLAPHESSVSCTVGGYHIPPGTMLMVNMWAIQNSPEIWDEPTEFRPERFGERDGPKDGFKFLPFGSGRRSCPAEGLAFRIVGLTLGSVIQCFDWERPSKEMIDLSEGSIGLSMPMAKPLVARCRPRPVIAKLLSRV